MKDRIKIRDWIMTMRTRINVNVYKSFKFTKLMYSFRQVSLRRCHLIDDKIHRKRPRER